MKEKQITPLLLALCVVISITGTWLFNKKNDDMVFSITLPSYRFPYDLSSVAGTHELPVRLKEVSGVSLTKGGLAACVQDEEGIVFIYDIANDTIVEQFRFANDGDYEGITYVNDTIFVLRADGALYEIQKGEQEAVLHPTPFDERYDTEGLCYDSLNNRLLVACKGKAGKGKEYKNAKAVYAFNLETKTYDTIPVYLIKMAQLIEFSKNANKKTAELLFDNMKDDFPFHPSGISINPISGNIYLIASRGKMLVVISPKGDILYIEKFDKNVFSQPEGITFFPTGEMLIASEGKQARAVILRFNPR